MDVGRSFSFVFQDPKWVSKLAIGALMVLIPIFGWLVFFGYTMQVARRIALTGTDLPLPEWDDFGALFVDGWRAFAVYVMWSLPLIVISFGSSVYRFVVDDESDGLSLALGCLQLPLTFAFGVATPAAITREAVEGRFSAGLEVGRVLQIVRTRLGDYVVIAVMIFIGAFLAAFGLIALCVGILVTFALYYLFLGHLYGQAYRRAVGPAIGSGVPAY